MILNHIKYNSFKNGACKHGGGSNFPLYGFKGTNGEGGTRAASIFHAPGLLPKSREGSIHNG